ncbi:MAG: hypothetical protein R2825_29275 [Saprospiraceae bacterium]
MAKYAKEEDEKAAKSEVEEIALDHRTSIYKDRIRASLADNMPGWPWCGRKWTTPIHSVSA